MAGPSRPRALPEPRQTRTSALSHPGALGLRDVIPAGALTSAGVGVGLARAGSLWRAGAQPPGRPLLPASSFKGLRRLREAKPFPRLLRRPCGECSSFRAPRCEAAWGARACGAWEDWDDRAGARRPGARGSQRALRSPLADSVSFGSPNSKSCSRK